MISPSPSQIGSSTKITRFGTKREQIYWAAERINRGPSPISPVWDMKIGICPRFSRNSRAPSRPHPGGADRGGPAQGQRQAVTWLIRNSVNAELQTTVIGSPISLTNRPGTANVRDGHCEGTCQERGQPAAQAAVLVSTL